MKTLKQEIGEVKRHSVTGYGRQDINYNDPEGEFVYYEDYAALQQKLDALAAENAALKDLQPTQQMITAAHRELEEYDNIQIDDDAVVFTWQAMRGQQKTPATDAYLNSVRAEGLKMAIDHMNNQTSDDCADVTVLPVIEMYKKLISGTHDTEDKAG